MFLAPRTALRGPAACCLKEMALPAVPGSFEYDFQEQHASWPAGGTCSFMFHSGIFFHGKIWRLQEASQPLLLPPTAKSISYRAFRAKRHLKRQQMTKQLT